MRLQALGVIFAVIGVVNTTHRQLTGMIWCVRFREILLHMFDSCMYMYSPTLQPVSIGPLVLMCA